MLLHWWSLINHNTNHIPYILYWWQSYIFEWKGRRSKWASLTYLKNTKTHKGNLYNKFVMVFNSWVIDETKDKINQWMPTTYVNSAIIYNIYIFSQYIWFIYLFLSIEIMTWKFSLSTTLHLWNKRSFCSFFYFFFLKL